MSKQEILNDFRNKHLTSLIACQIDIRIFGKLKPGEIVGERAGPIKGSKVLKTAEEAVKEIKKQLKGHIEVLETIKELEKEL